MKHLIVSVTLAVIALSASGCTAKQEGGVPGTPDSFTLKVESSSTVKPGDKVQLAVTVDRHKKFKHDLTLTAQPGKDSKLTAQIDPGSIKMSDAGKATLTIRAAEDAPHGNAIVSVTATPTGEGSSAPSTVDIKIKVSK